MRLRGIAVKRSWAQLPGAHTTVLPPVAPLIPSPSSPKRASCRQAAESGDIPVRQPQDFPRAPACPETKRNQCLLTGREAVRCRLVQTRPAEDALCSEPPREVAAKPGQFRRSGIQTFFL